MLDPCKADVYSEERIEFTGKHSENKTLVRQYDALYWIMNQGEWKQFVSNRVNEVVKLSKKEDWGHCPSEQNPANTGSRGSLAVELKGNEISPATSR